MPTLTRILTSPPTRPDAGDGSRESASRGWPPASDLGQRFPTWACTSDIPLCCPGGGSPTSRRSAKEGRVPKTVPKTFRLTCRAGGKGFRGGVRSASAPCLPNNDSHWLPVCRVCLCALCGRTGCKCPCSGACVAEFVTSSLLPSETANLSISSSSLMRCADTRHPGMVSAADSATTRRTPASQARCV